MPATASIADLGDVTILSYKISEEFQESFLGGEVKPFLVPKTVHVNVVTDKGNVELTNTYVPKPVTETRRLTKQGS